VPIDPATSRAQLQALQHGEATALNPLIECWQPPLLGFAFRYVQNSADAHDLVAETFVKLYQRRRMLRPDTNLSAWLFTTLSHLCHNHHRWRRRHPTVPLDAPGGEAGFAEDRPPLSARIAAGELSPDALLAQDESVAAVQRAIAALPHELKATILLHHYERLSYREIATITGCSERGVETRLYRARQQLRKGLTRFFRETSRD
jgi:RNA polymerase sigma-70 factor (ECF subfamily)